MSNGQLHRFKRHEVEMLINIVYKNRELGHYYGKRSTFMMRQDKLLCRLCNIARTNGWKICEKFGENL